MPWIGSSVWHPEAPSSVMAICFHLDENMHSAIAQGLRQRGVDVTTTADVGMIGASDRQQLTYDRVNALSAII